MQEEPTVPRKRVQGDFQFQRSVAPWVISGIRPLPYLLFSIEQERLSQ